MDIDERITSKLMEGKPFMVQTDNPRTVSRMRTLAQHLGAAIEITEGSNGTMTQITLSPPARTRH